MNPGVILAHAQSIAHGIGASVLSMACLYIGGVALTPRRWDEPAGETPVVLGAALYVLLCWFGIALGVPLMRLANVFASAVLVLVIVRCRWLIPVLGARVLTRPVLGWLISFALLYVLAYVFTMPPATADYLPPAWTGNIDLLTYVRYTKYLLRLGPSNVAGFVYVNFIYFQTPAVFYLLGALSLLFGLDPLRAAMPAQFAFTALIGVSIMRISRSVFSLSRSSALAIACVFVSGPFFRYMAGAYFLSTLMSTPILLYLLWTTVTHRSQRLLDIGLALRFGSAYILLLLMYPFLLVVGVGAQAAGIILILSADIQSGAVGRPAWREAFHRAARMLSAVLVPLGLLLLCIRQPTDFNHVTSSRTTSRLAWSIDMVRGLSEKGIAGWPLDLLSPLAMLGVPATRTDHVRCPTCLGVEVGNPKYRELAIVAFCTIALVLVFLYFWRFRRVTTSAQRAFAGLAAGSFVVYCAYFLRIGPSYQQWKFASYSVLPLSFVVFAGGLQLFQQSAVFARATRTAVGQRVTTALLAMVAVGLIGGNLVFHALGDPVLRRFPGTLRNLAMVDALPFFRELSMQMATDNVYETWLGLYFLPSKRVHVIDPRFSPSEPLSFERISRQKPLLIQNYWCEGIGHGDTITVPDVGCLLLEPPSLAFDTSYPFNRSFLFVDYKGLGPRENQGRWNDGSTVTFKLLADLRRAWVSQDTYVNLRLNPYLPPGTARQRVVFAWGADQHAEVSLTDGAWISLPVRRADWTGDRVRTLPISMDLPDGIVPPWMYAPRGRLGEGRIAILFEDLSIGASPLGRAVGPIRGPARQ